MTKRVKLMPLSEQIINAILESGLTQYELSKRTGVDRSRLHHVTKGDGWFSRESLDAIAKELRLKIVRVSK
jgi:transcriptional regulator with XRE-family HTH domain